VLLSIRTSCFTVLYVGAFMILIMSQIGMLVLCNFSCAFSVGSEVFFWVMYFIFCLSMIKLHCHSVFSVRFFNFLVGSLEIKRK